MSLLNSKKTLRMHSKTNKIYPNKTKHNLDMTANVRYVFHLWHRRLLCFLWAVVRDFEIVACDCPFFMNWLKIINVFIFMVAKWYLVVKWKIRNATLKEQSYNQIENIEKETISIRLTYKYMTALSWLGIGTSIKKKVATRN